MRNQSGFEPWWAACIVWGVVNAVCVLQAAGFLSRIPTGSMAVNHILGYVMILLAIPSMVALVAFARAGAGWLRWASPILFMGLPMYRLNRQLWLVTVATTVLLLGAMGAAMRKGVG